MLLSRVYVMTFLVCQQCFVLFYFIDHALHEHGTITKTLLTHFKLHYINMVNNIKHS
jgi:hypothetical protein